MKGRIKGLIIVILAIIAIILPSRVAYAETLEDRMNNLIMPEARYNTKLSSQYLKNNESEENINSQNGELILKQRDYSLPGRNGLDVNIERIFKSGSSATWESHYKYVNGTWVEDHVCSDETFIERRYGLGKDNRFSFPTIEIKNNSDNTSYKYLHMDNGEVYRLSTPNNVNGVITYTLEYHMLKDITIQECRDYSNGQADGKSKYVMIDKDGKKTYFSEDGRILGIRDRYNNKISFEYTDLKYTYTETNNPYTISKRLISKITDTLGRDIKIRYSQGNLQADGTFLVTKSCGNFYAEITFPDNKTIMYANAPWYVELGKDSFYYTYLSDVYDEYGNSKYEFRCDSEKINDNEPEYNGNRMLVLKRINYSKSNLFKEFKYSDYSRRLIGTIPDKYKKVVEIDEYEKKSGNHFWNYTLELKNKISYNYVNEPDGYGYTGYKPDDDSYLKDSYRYYSEQTDLKGTKRKYTYNGKHELLNIEENGANHKQVASFTYDTNKLVNKKEVVMQDVVNGQVSGKLSKKVENYSYDDYGNLTSYTSPLAARDSNGNPVNNEFTTKYTYATDKFNILTSKTWKKDANTTSKVEYTVDSHGNITQEEQAHKENGIDNRVITDYAYDEYGNMTKKAINRTYVTNYEYGTDADGMNQKGGYLTKEYSIVNGNEVSKKYCYDFNTGLLKREIDPNNNSKSIEYDKLSRVTKITFPDKSQQVYDYLDSEYSDNSGNILRRNKQIIYTDPNKNKFVYQYDIYGNLVEHDINDKVIKKIAYDSDRNKTKEIDAKGNSIHYDYDSANRLIKKSFWENDNTEKKAMTLNYCNGYDANTPLLITETNEEGYVSKYYYDILNRLIKKQTTPDKTNYYTVNYTYDYVSNKLSESDNKNNTTQYTYDDLNRLIANKDPLGNTKQYSYNAIGKTIEEKSAKNVPTYYHYDELGRMIEKVTINSNGNFAITRFVYDNVGNKIKEITPNNYDYAKQTPQLVLSMVGISYAYDNMNRLISTSSAEGKVIEYRKYDANGNLAKTVDGIRYNGNIDTSKGKSLVYDAWGRVTQTTDALGNKEYYSYDLLGNLLEYTNANGKKTSYTYNADGTLGQVKYIDGGTVKYTYDKIGHKLSQEDQRGNVTRYVYNGYGKVVEEYDAYNNKKSYKYDENGNLLEGRNYDDSVTYYTYDANNRLKEKKAPLEIDASKNVVYSTEEYDYDELGNIKRKVLSGTKDSPSKREINYSYYDNGLLNTITTSGGAYTKNYYDNNGNVIKNETLKDTGIYDVTKNVYDKNNRVIETISLVDKKDIYNAATIPNIDNISDYSGIIKLITGYEYDILGNVTKIIDPRAYGYLENDKVNRDKYSTVKTYDALNRPEKLIWKYNDTDVYKQYYYDAAGNKVKERNEKGNFTEYTYDDLNRVKTIKDALGKTMTYEYDLSGNKISETNAKNSKMCYVYDKLNRLTTTIDPYGKVISEKVYDNKGNIVKSIDAKGYKSGATNESRYGTIYTYDLANRLIKVVDPEIAALKDASKYKAKYEYNQYGEKTKEIDALGNGTRYEYDNSGKLIKVVDAKNIPTQYTYDNKGNKVSTIDGRNNTIKYVYGSQGIHVSSTNAENKTISYQYDLALNKAKEVDRNGSIKLNTYDIRNLLLSKSIPSTGDSIEYSYDELGNRISMKDSTGTTSYSYNSNNWLTNVSKMAAVQVQYTYDDIGNVISVKDKKGYLTNYEYDNCSRLSKVSYTVAGSAKSTSYSYDDNGNRNLITYSGGVKEEYEYDKNNKLLTLKNKKPDGSVISSYAYTYDLAGRQVSKTDSYGVSNYSYDVLGRIERITAPGKTTVYAYDNVGNRIALNETYTSNQISEYKNYNNNANVAFRIKSSQYTYSNSNMLLKIDEAMTNSRNIKELERSISYDYDNNGNEKKQTVEAKVKNMNLVPIDPPPTEEYAIGSSKLKINAISAEKVGASINNLVSLKAIEAFPIKGPEINDTNYKHETYSTTNEYDGFNRLKKSTLAKDSNTTTTEYKYNGDDLRVKKVVTKVNNGVTSVDETNYLYDGQNVILETDANDNVKVRYIKGINYIARIDNTDKLSYYLFNGHGDVVQTVSENGTVENQYDYDIFGNATLTVEAYGNAIRYGGEFFDADGGLYYLRSRYYDPYIGRFVTQDSFGGDDVNPLSLNLYTYCENDPINFLDPTGHYPEMVSYDPNNYSATVGYLQEQLNKYNYGLAVDGYFGQHTLDAVRDYQYKHYLEVDGIVGPQTWGSLLARSAPQPTPTPTPTASTNSGNNSSGGYVQYNPNTYNPEAKRVQQILNGKGASLKEDGYFGDNTLAAVQKFQRANGLDDDGIVGPQTWGMLLSNSSVYYGGSRSGRNNSRPAYEPDEGNSGSTLSPETIKAWNDANEAFDKEATIANRFLRGTIIGTAVDVSIDYYEFSKYMLLFNMGDKSQEGVVYVTEEQVKWAEAGADICTGELQGMFIGVTINGVRGVKNLITGEISYGSDAIAACGMGSTAGKSELHHIASDKSLVSGFTAQYEKIFKNAGMNLQDDANLIFLEGHSGAHTKAYKQYVLDYITNATKGLKGDTAKEALTKALTDLKDQLINNPKMPYKGGL